MNSSIKLTPFQTGSPLLETATQIYTETWSFNFEDTIDFVRWYAECRGFVGFVATKDEIPVAMGFGIESIAGNWWHDIVTTAVGRDNPALKNAWALVEFCVLENYRKEGVGSLLHDKLLETQVYPRVLLSTRVENEGARRFYERKQWQCLHPGVVFGAGEPAYMIMSRDTKLQK